MNQANDDVGADILDGVAPMSPAFDADPSEVFRALRESDPVHWWPTLEAWVVTSYADVMSVLRDSAHFTPNHRVWEKHRRSSDRAGATPRSSTDQRVPEAVDRDRYDWNWYINFPGLRADGANHVRLRRLVSLAFTPKAVRRQEEIVTGIVDEVLSRLDGRAEFDVAQDVAQHIPVVVISRILGIPRGNEDEFERYARIVMRAANPLATREDTKVADDILPRFKDLVTDVIETRRAEPDDDLITGLVQAEEDGDHLTYDEMLMLILTLVAAGSDTTVKLIGLTVLELLRHPDQRELVRADPTLVADAVEETLRHQHVSKWMHRFAVEDVDLGGKRIGKGQLVLVSLPAALRDPEIFANPDRFDVQRDTTASIGFGHGAHHCVGAALARLETRITVGRLLDCYPDMAIAGEVEYLSDFLVRGPTSLPVTV